MLHRVSLAQAAKRRNRKETEKTDFRELPLHQTAAK